MTLEQDRAMDALEKAKNVKRKDSRDFKEKYRSYVDRLGPTILMNGLGQALATELAAGGGGHENANQDAHSLLYSNIRSWICRKGGVYQAGEDLLSALMRNSQENYLHAQAEVLKWLEWHKKFCRAFLPKPKSVD